MSLTVTNTLVSSAFLSDIRIWDVKLKTAARRWITNFTEEEQDHAAAILETFIFFSDELVDRLFLAAFDVLAAEITEPAHTYANKKTSWQSFLDRVLVTHPTGEMPNVTDSGYAFDRRARQLLGINQAHIMEPEATIAHLISSPGSPVVFVDDFVGSGDQFCKTWHRMYDVSSGSVSFATIASSGRTGPFYYCPLVSTQRGLSVVDANCPSLRIRPTHLLPNEYSANHAASLIWPDALRGHSGHFVEQSSARAGIPPAKRWGYANLALALAFQHGVPDATLPIVWWEDNGWIPLVPRR
jgi:hypothetical protein